MDEIKQKRYWQFSYSSSIEDYRFNESLERFYNMGISGLVRENIQNSLDAKIPGAEGPVLVKIETGKINQKYIPGIDEIKERILSLEGRNNYTIATIENMKNKMDQEMADYISFEDSNTKGLKGAKNGQSDSKEDTWSIYAYKKGDHSVENDSELEMSRGGSHGIGKIASNAASELYMMFFANCDEFQDQHLGGTVQLIEHKYKDNYYRSSGYFADKKNIEDDKSKLYPFENTFNEVFKKDTRGLKIIIPYLRSQFNDEREIIKSICDSFFIAILQDKLEVIVNDKKINKETVGDYILSAEYYEQKISDIKTEFTPLYYRTYINQKEQLITIKSKNKDYSFKLFFDYDTEIAKGRTAIIRTIGMKIEDKKITGHVNKPFNAVLIPGSIEEDAFLKSLENESHTELSFKHIKDQGIQANAKRFINNISKEIAYILEKEIKSKNPTDGAMDTKDILYVVENEFKKDLADTVSKVKLKDGNGKEKIIVKVNPETRKKNEKKETKKKGVKKVKKPRDKRDKTDISGDDSREKLTKYSTHPDMVERVIAGSNEYVKFDFSDSKEIKNVKLCDVSLAVVDGMGNEYENEFNIKNNYSEVIDMSSGSKCSIEDNKIKDVKLVDGIAQINLKLKDNYNTALKFVYYVEV